MYQFYTDGSCKPTNPGFIGFGVVIVKDGKLIKEYNKYLGHGTNNIAELSAIECAIDFMSELKLSWSDDIEIITDSQYCIGVLTKGWKAKKNPVLIRTIKSKLENYPNVDIITTGGSLNKADLSYYGKVAEDTAARFHANKAIIGASGISLQRGVTTPNEHKAELKKIMIGNCQDLIIVVDHTKLERIALVPVCSIERVQMIITDSKAQRDIINAYEDNGVQVKIAD